MKARNYLETLNLSSSSSFFFFFFFFALACEKIFIQTHCIQSRCVIEPEHTPFLSGVRGICQPGNFTGWGSEGVDGGLWEVEGGVLKGDSPKEGADVTLWCVCV